MQTEQMKLLNTIETKILNEYKDGWMACDSTLAAALINPKVKLDTYLSSIKMKMIVFQKLKNFVYFVSFFRLLRNKNHFIVLSNYMELIQEDL